MSRTIATIPFAALLCAAAVLAGCQSRSAHRHQSPALEPTYRGDATAHARPSIVFPSPQLRRAEARAAVSDAEWLSGGLPWYATRNDYLPAVHAGYRSAVFEHVHTFTRDEQAIRGRHIYDQHSTRTYRSGVYEVVR